MTEPFVKLKDRCFVATVLPTLLLLLFQLCGRGAVTVRR